MHVTINGYPHKIEDDQRLDSIISSVSRTPDRVIAEVNGRLVKSASWTQTILREGDTIELVTLVGGG